MSTTPESRSDDFAESLVSTLRPTPPNPTENLPGPPPRPRGFFAELLADHVDPLHADALEHTDRYDTETKVLLEELTTRPRRAVTPAERLLLDRATFEFATAKSRNTAAPEPLQPKLRKKAKREEDEDEDEDVDGDTPLDTLPDFWWA